MRATLQEALYAAYPALFRQRTLPLTESGMGRGIECTDGWYWLLDGLCSVLMGHACSAGHEPLEAVQVKSKLGSLRFYSAGGCSWCRGAIGFAEALSQRVCEETGRSGVLMVRSRRQLRTLALDVGLANGYSLVEPATGPIPLVDASTVGWTTIIQGLLIDLPSEGDDRAGRLACAEALAARDEAFLRHSVEETRNALDDDC